MLYQNDAHHYRALIRRRQRRQRIKGISLLAVSLALTLYAVPCFAVSVWDYEEQGGILSTMFSSGVNDREAASAQPGADSAAAAIDEQEAATGQAIEAAPIRGSRPTGDLTVGETTGPGLLSDEAAVSAAKTRAKAMEVASQGQSTMVYAKSADVADEPAATPNLLYAFIAMALAVACAILGVRTIMRGRLMRGMEISTAYRSALRA